MVGRSLLKIVRVRILMVHMNAVVFLDILVILNLMSNAKKMVVLFFTDAFRNHVTTVTMDQKVMDVINYPNIQSARVKLFVV